MAFVRRGSISSVAMAIHNPNSVAYKPSTGWQTRKKDESESVFNPTAEDSALAPKLVVSVCHHPDHLRVARWDLFDDCGPAVVRLPSP